MAIRVRVAAKLEGRATTEQLDAIAKQLTDLDPVVFTGDFSVLVRVRIVELTRPRARAAATGRVADALAAAGCVALAVNPLAARDRWLPANPRGAGPSDHL